MSNLSLMMKSTLYLINAEDQLSKMKLAKNNDAKAHLSELQKHFKTIVQHRDNLIKMGLSMSNNCFNTLIISSLPESYQPTLQTITAAERSSKLSGQSHQMKTNDLISFITEKAQHRLINDEHTKMAETALAAHVKRNGKRKGAKSKMGTSNPDVNCKNCKKDGHTKNDCWSKWGEKEGQGPKQNKKTTKVETAIVAANVENNKMFAFTCTSNYAMVAENISKSRLSTCINSGASQVYSPNKEKFTNYKSIDQEITTADGRAIKVISMGDLNIDLPNGSKQTKNVFKNAIHAPDMAFTLISIS